MKPPIETVHDLTAALLEISEQYPRDYHHRADFRAMVDLRNRLMQDQNFQPPKMIEYLVGMRASESFNRRKYFQKRNTGIEPVVRNPVRS
jgi:hypothetical protein